MVKSQSPKKVNGIIFFKKGVISMKYYERLRDIREDSDLHQKDIAKILGTTTQKISDYENGNVMMRVDKYITLAKYYNISLDYLTGLINIPRPLFEDQTITREWLTEKEKKLLTAYKGNPQLQAAIDKLLDLEK